MKRIYVFMLAAMLLVTMKGFGQNYYSVQNYGFAFQFSQTPTVIMAAPQTSDVLSSWISLPFSFSFYGKTYSGFYASDNGYITFDDKATKSFPSNKSLPSGSAPNLSISAFWDDFTLNQNVESTYPSAIYGWSDNTGGKNKYVIEWTRVVPNGGVNSDDVYFMLVLNQDGTFDVYNYYKNTNASHSYSGTVGTQSDSTLGYSLTGSPNLDYTTGKYYHFAYGHQSNVDVATISTSLTTPVASATSNTLTGSMINYGSKAVSSMDINYSVDGGTPVTESVSPSLSSSGGNFYTYTFGSKWKNATPGMYHTIKIWASNFNGGTDKDSANANDTLTATVFVNNGVSATKNVLVEEGTGAWCGYCPDGGLILHNVLETYPNAIGISLHNMDSMATPDGDAVTQHFNNVGFPFGMVDRAYFGATLGGPAMNRGNWTSATANRLNAPTPVDIKITPTWNASTNTVSVKVDCKFLDYAVPGDLRLNVCIVEDSVRGNDGTYNAGGYVWESYTQHNYFSSKFSSPQGGTSHPLYNEPEYLIGYLHNHVLMANISGDPWGDNSIIPNAPAPNETYTGSYNYTFPDMIPVNTPQSGTGKYTKSGKGFGKNKPWNSHIVAFVSYGDNTTTNVLTQQILNSASALIPGVTLGIQDVEHSSNISAEVYPNPTNSIARIALNLPTMNKVKVEVMNSLGQSVQNVQEGTFTEGMHNFYVDATNFNNGVYFVNITTENTRIVKRFVVAK